MQNISVIVPVYNSENVLPELIKRLHPVLEKLHCEYELILINDGSADRSWDTILQLIEQYQFIKGINLMRNFGQHNALLCGIRAACYDIIVTIDDDLQHPPEEIPKLLDKMKAGYDVVYGTPRKGQHGFFRILASKLTKIALQTTMGIETASKVSAFRAFNTHLRNGFRYYNSSFVSIDVLLTWGAIRFTSVITKHDSRQFGDSNYTFRMLFNHALNMMTGFSVLPLQIASFLGFAVMLFGIIALVFVIANFFIRGGGTPGFSFVASIITIFSGTQLFVLGIMGEYLARMHFRIMDKPSYIIREEFDKEIGVERGII